MWTDKDLYNLLQDTLGKVRLLQVERELFSLADTFKIEVMFMDGKHVELFVGSNVGLVEVHTQIAELKG